VGDNVAISYRGARYEIGRGQGFYGIWAAGAPESQPFEWWPETPEGWRGAWSKFAGIEAPGTIVAVGQRTAPAAGHTGPGAERIAPAGGHAGPGAERIAPAGGRTAPAGERTGPGGERTGPGGERTGPGGRPGAPAVLAASLLAIGVACGIAGLFPGYLTGASLAQEPAELVPHAIYFAVWGASAVLILLGPARLRVGAMLGLGTSIVTFGFFFADVGQAIAGGAHVMGAGLVLGLVGWLACAAGSAVAFRLRPAGAPARPYDHELGLVLALALAALGAAVAFAPSWDSYILRTSTGATQSITAGNAFANPAPVIAGNIAVMVALVAVVVLAALWRPIREGVALLAGAIIPMAAQAISALVQLGEGTSPAQFGISPAQAAQAGLTISAGVTPEFWIYCGFVVALVVLTCARLFSRPRSAVADSRPSRPIPGISVSSARPSD